MAREKREPRLENPARLPTKRLPILDPRASLPPPARVARAPAIIVTLIIAAIVGLSLWYLVQPQPIVIQGEADATRIDIAARVDGRVAKRPVERGDNVAAGQLLYEIDNPELLTKLREAEAALASPTPSSPISRPARGRR